MKPVVTTHGPDLDHSLRPAVIGELIQYRTFMTSILLQVPDTDSSSPSFPISSLAHTTDTYGDPVYQAEKLVTEALDKLEATGALQHSNRMDLEESLSPAAETHNLFEATDEDIFQAVMDAKAAWEANKGGCDDDDLDGPVEPPLTRKEVLLATLVLRSYISKLDSPFARELEVMLGWLGRRTRHLDMEGMKDNKITNYFAPK